MIRNITVAYKVGFSSGFNKSYLYANEAIIKEQFQDGITKWDARKLRSMRRAFINGFNECKQLQKDIAA